MGRGVSLPLSHQNKILNILKSRTFQLSIFEYLDVNPFNFWPEREQILETWAELHVSQKLVALRANSRTLRTPQRVGRVIADTPSKKVPGRCLVGGAGFEPATSRSWVSSGNREHTTRLWQARYQATLPSDLKLARKDRT